MIDMLHKNECGGWAFWTWSDEELLVARSVQKAITRDGTKHGKSCMATLRPQWSRLYNKFDYGRNATRRNHPYGWRRTSFGDSRHIRRKPPVRAG